ncbi:MAG: alpha-hydroxy-acid oxidizing enzyme [Proteobacteria bacterium]|nr:alpha-hydroxy-acid oxidizing enzyme [Pseudomonadota bacterium]
MLLNLDDIEQEALNNLDPQTLAYYASGADDEQTLSKNTEAWRELWLRPRAFVDVSTVDLSTTVLGQSIEHPIMVPPMAFQQLAHPQGEAALASAAGAHGTVYCLSTISNIPMEQVVKSTSGPVWFQLYVDRDRCRAHRLIDRAAESGCTALVVTVDTPLLGHRERDVRLGFRMPAHLKLPNLPNDGHELTLADVEPTSALARFATKSLDPSLSWSDLESFAKRSSLPIVAKGILRGDDAQKAIDHGAQAVIVSNHGGRQLDTAIPTAWALPEVVDVVGDQAEIYVDGGLRRGTDIVKALALGARAVLVGRPFLWGLAIDGTAGAEHVLKILRSELERALALSGVPSLNECTSDLIWRG